MRRSDREITDFNEIIAVIKKCDVCRLAFNDGEVPYLLPLNFGLNIEEGRINLYFHSALEGTKMELIAQNNKASFEMDCGHRLVIDEKKGQCTMEYESVIGRGYITILKPEEKYDALCILMQQYGRNTPLNASKELLDNTAVYKMTVESCTGKRRKVKNSIE